MSNDVFRATAFSRRDALRSLSAVMAATLVSPRVHAAFALELKGDLAPVHDPCIIKSGRTYHLFSTGHLGDATGLIPWRTSTDLINWKVQGQVFEKLPEWAQETIPGTRGLWAPDIAHVNGRYHLYYSVSTFGSNVSAIGLATNATLDPQAKNFEWRDEGIVLRSSKADDFNAIDPNHLVDSSGNRWLSVGSFWSGLKLFPLDAKSGRVIAGATRKISLASRPAPAGAPQAIEAPFIIRRGEFYYLFASYDYCCRGLNSSYYVAVGRSRDVTGPYVGSDGKAMNDGYGTLLLRGDRQFRGPGHCAVLQDADTDYLVYHAYDAQAEGRPTLRIAPLSWRDGWPMLAT